MGDWPATLPEALTMRAAQQRGELVFHGPGDARSVTSADLAELARSAASRLASLGIGRGDPVGLMGSNTLEWAVWAFGIWTAGATLVPLGFPMRIRDRSLHVEQVRAVARTTACRLVVHEPALAPLVPDALGSPWDPPSSHGAASLPVVEPDDVAVIQFTSGSTASPKGVLLTHGAILAERLATVEAHRLGERDTRLGWMPFFHDAGLFSYLAHPIVAGVTGHFLPTASFARDPAEWFRAVTRCAAIYTGGPPTAWAAAMRAAAREPEGIDLSRLRVAFVGGESIDAEAMDMLIEVGSGLGLDPDAVLFGYGLAEATLHVSTTAPGGGVRFDAVDLDELARGRAAPAAGRGTRRVATCGRPHPGVEVKTVDASGVDLGERDVGEILVRGPGLMRGYIGDDVPDPFLDGWLRTGDLGYLADGELFVTGRIKDVVIVYGHNYYPEDFEWVAGRTPGVRPGRCVAFGRPDREGEVVVIVEPAEGAEPEQLATDVRHAITDAIGVLPADVLVVPPGTVQKTTSGKLRRGAMRDAFRRGELALQA